MFFFLSKALDFLVLPLSIVFLLLIFALLTRHRTYRRRAVLAAILLLYLLSNSYLVNWAYRAWEYAPVNLQEVPQTYDVGVVLTGGMISVPSLDADHPGLGDHADRFLQAYLLYKAGKIRKILISGTDAAPVVARNLSDGQQASALLTQWGVPHEDIIVELKSRNTRENALFSAAILRDQFPGGRYLLITSAFHMRRSVGCFQKAGLDVGTFPADFYGGAFSPSVKQLLVPEARVFGYAELLWHEWIGFVVYKLVGYC
ncbi:YdcF family protein [Rhabdobacter roseus]|uniref:Uncharacterized SAM-binding protein YcdF (DUF218 family) n=1 Tax=Rhabdobacter roseus TaxID=1655419 RepID=A0A840TRK6_9BACT|nr:YdcF family protein [Rhabdobacter roseus]MBB5282660.1 uncharacterized SAM-binding protein YcdF (DUF218 family) [Rhabdobacter roseus]